MNQTQHTEVQSSENATVQSSEAMRVGLLLTLTGGFLDAYTYLVRGCVSAFLGATGRIRTSGLPGRSRTLYPAELRSHLSGYRIIGT